MNDSVAAYGLAERVARCDADIEVMQQVRVAGVVSRAGGDGRCRTPEAPRACHEAVWGGPKEA